jgi:hypothetical protein
MPLAPACSGSPVSSEHVPPADEPARSKLESCRIQSSLASAISSLARRLRDRGRARDSLVLGRDLPIGLHVLRDRELGVEGPTRGEEPRLTNENTHHESLEPTGDCLPRHRPPSHNTAPARVGMGAPSLLTARSHGGGVVLDLWSFIPGPKNFPGKVPDNSCGLWSCVR